LPAVDTAGEIRFFERRTYPKPHVDAEFLCEAAKSSGLPEKDAVVRDAWFAYGNVCGRNGSCRPIERLERLSIRPAIAAGEAGSHKQGGGSDGDERREAGFRRAVRQAR
jgi:hypothetical protein